MKALAFALGVVAGLVVAELGRQPVVIVRELGACSLELPELGVRAPAPLQMSDVVAAVPL